MNFKYSICFPDQKEIQYFNEPITRKEVLEIAKNYPWLEQIHQADAMDQNKVHYSPSIDFTNLQDKRSFCLTADLDDNKNLSFSLWYNRPKKVKVLFGLFGEKETMIVDDVWNYNFNQAIQFLEHFVNQNYQIIEELYSHR
ncbi:hypothetical protein [Moheibacter sp.]|uniref:hypothetical protein n=1 Tax=Moheibacter sp. TaxID=1965316 RepID=UPI003C76FC8B